MKSSMISLMAVFSTILLAGCSSEGTDNAQLEADISPVAPKVASTVVDIRVSDNQRVRKGDTLVLLDDATYKIAVTQAEIELQTALKSVRVAGNNRLSADVIVSNNTANADAVSANQASARASIESAQAQLDVAAKNFDRYSRLYEQKSATQQQYDQAKADKIAAEAKLQAARSAMDVLLKQIDASKLQVTNSRTQRTNSDENIGVAELEVKKAQARLDAARLQLSYCTIVAPADGIVSKKNVQLGQVAEVGSPLMAIANDSKIWVVANFKETQVEKIKKNQAVEVKVDAYPDTVFTGQVESLAQATGAKFSFLPADNATGNFVKVTQRIPVKISLPTTQSVNYPLRAGMSVYVSVKTK